MEIGVIISFHLPMIQRERIMYYTYILIAMNRRQTYVGYTSDLTNRLLRHNGGLVNSTKANKPYKILHVDQFESLDEAKAKERYYKNYRGRQKIRQMLEWLVCLRVI